MIFTHFSQFHICIPFTDKKSFTFNTHDVASLATFFSQNRFYFPLFSERTFVCHIAEPPFDWFLNVLRPSPFSYQEEKSIITAIQSVTIQTYFIDENALRRKINIYFDTVYYTTAHYTAQLYSPFAITTFGFYFRN